MTDTLNPLVAAQQKVKAACDKLGCDPAVYEILKEPERVIEITIPVKIGRNLAIIIEAAAMNFRAKTMGYDATKAFERNLNNLIKENSEN